MISHLELEQKLATVRRQLRVKGEFVRPFHGSQPATDAGLRAFIEHHLGIPPESHEFDQTFRRIRTEEIQETTPPEGEVKTETVYGVNVVRKTEFGPWLASWQVQACIKVAASRLDIFTKKRGSKGDIAELGTVAASGISLQRPDHPSEIYLRNGSGLAPETHFEVINGSVGTPQGKKSIQHHTEIVDAGTQFEFTIDWINKRLSDDDMLLCIAAAQHIGLGACRSIGGGDWKVLEAELVER